MAIRTAFRTRIRSKSNWRSKYASSSFNNYRITFCNNRWDNICALNRYKRPADASRFPADPVAHSGRARNVSKGCSTTAHTRYVSYTLLFNYLQILPNDAVSGSDRAAWVAGRSTMKTSSLEASSIVQRRFLPFVSSRSRSLTRDTPNSFHQHSLCQSEHASIAQYPSARDVPPGTRLSWTTTDAL